jgi:GNAT superfamily N-acetyltransferase
MITITYRDDAALTVGDFLDVLKSSGLAARRPVEDTECLQGMIDHANLTVTAWADGRLIGVARSVTDFHYCCYLSDLAVHRDYQRQGVGRELIRWTRGRLGSRCTLILIAAPDANDYYPHLGFTHQPRTWILPGRPT